ncbi:putative transcription regulator [Bacteroides fragilis str. 1007-1-F |jgi:hypothetical protein|uniref:Transcription regulator n=2 Tax=Bacteroides fragilis TaxID=817 RepID=A0AAN4MUB8_BACFG|nr:putative transcription regulator [Bacteroides fragilis str. 3783N1-2]EXY48538.1 putative transcription regulator [Bacteroides fragilis str. 3783N2-1]EXY53644.1 putative transcription regulator [Bacteroides fragilis str. 3976T7]EXZ36676.1 putative transcription regulator [Bacteroides fragilis str. 1007-1-F \
MGILYLKEHATCYNYMSCVREGFLYHQFQPGELNEETNEADCIFFILEGELETLASCKLVHLSCPIIIDKHSQFLKYPYC